METIKYLIGSKSVFVDVLWKVIFSFSYNDRKYCASEFGNPAYQCIYCKHVSRLFLQMHLKSFISCLSKNKG